MGAIEKIDAAGIKLIAERTGRSLSVVYRWRKALREGQPIGTRAIRELVQATADRTTPLMWADFGPADA